MSSFLDTEITYLSGLGPQRAQIIAAELNFKIFRDLIYYFPFRYIDRSRFNKVFESYRSDVPVQLKGKIHSVRTLGEGRKKRLVATFSDNSGDISLVWFKGIKWVEPLIKSEAEFMVYGKPSRFGNAYNITHPEVEKLNRNKTDGKIQPVYSTTEGLTKKGLNTKGIEKIMRSLVNLSTGKIEETLSENLIKQYNFISLETALKEIHFPSNFEMLKKAQLRLKFDELFFMQLVLIRQKLTAQKKYPGFVFGSVGLHFNTFYRHHLPFTLTNAQKRVVKEIRKDLSSGLHMNRLLQGDVGSGKTLVATLIMLIALDSNFQAVLLAPTEILATQHFNSIKDLLEPMGIKLSLLTGSTKTADRKILHTGLLEGNIQILIGTHAVLEDKVRFRNLGLAVIDEQHKFGVAQRAKLWKKNTSPPHILVMTATPIPRTLAMTFYGDLDISVIDELPPGRKPVETKHLYDAKRLVVNQFIEDQIKQGRQVYVVYPLIEESEKLDYKDLHDGYEAMSRRFPMPQYQIAIVHGKLKPEDKEYEMQRFAQGKAQILVSTTVIEVGVNVPNASVMVIESAEKFGLSTLHQLRGRVGRGADQSYCILMTSYKLSEDAKKRMETMVRTTDGFEIAEVDLRMRGPGDIMGTQQSGILDLKIANLAKDTQILNLARIAATEIMDEDYGLTHKKHFRIRKRLTQFLSKHKNWSRVS